MVNIRCLLYVAHSQLCVTYHKQIDNSWFRSKSMWMIIFIYVINYLHVMLHVCVLRLLSAVYAELREAEAGSQI